MGPRDLAVAAQGVRVHADDRRLAAGPPFLGSTLGGPLWGAWELDKILLMTLNYGPS